MTWEDFKRQHFKNKYSANPPKRGNNTRRNFNPATKKREKFDSTGEWDFPISRQVFPIKTPNFNAHAMPFASAEDAFKAAESDHLSLNLGKPIIRPDSWRPRSFWKNQKIYYGRNEYRKFGTWFVDDTPRESATSYESGQLSSNPIEDRFFATSRVRWGYWQGECSSNHRSPYVNYDSSGATMMYRAHCHMDKAGSNRPAHCGVSDENTESVYKASLGWYCDDSVCTDNNRCTNGYDVFEQYNCCFPHRVPDTYGGFARRCDRSWTPSEHYCIGQYRRLLIGAMRSGIDHLMFDANGAIISGLWYNEFNDPFIINMTSADYQYALSRLNDATIDEIVRYVAKMYPECWLGHSWTRDTRIYKYLAANDPAELRRLQVSYCSIAANSLNGLCESIVSDPKTTVTERTAINGARLSHCSQEKNAQDSACTAAIRYMDSNDRDRMWQLQFDSCSNDPENQTCVDLAHNREFGAARSGDTIPAIKSKWDTLYENFCKTKPDSEVCDCMLPKEQLGLNAIQYACLNSKCNNKPIAYKNSEQLDQTCPPICAQVISVTAESAFLDKINMIMNCVNGTDVQKINENIGKYKSSTMGDLFLYVSYTMGLLEVDSTVIPPTYRSMVDNTEYAKGAAKRSKLGISSGLNTSLNDSYLKLQRKISEFINLLKRDQFVNASSQDVSNIDEIAKRLKEFTNTIEDPARKIAAEIAALNNIFQKTQNNPPPTGTPVSILDPPGSGPESSPESGPESDLPWGLIVGVIIAILALIVITVIVVKMKNNKNIPVPKIAANNST